VLTLEVLADLQALSFRNAQGLGTGTRRIYEALTPHFSVYDNQRIFHDDLVRFRGCCSRASCSTTWKRTGGGVRTRPGVC